MATFKYSQLSDPTKGYRLLRLLPGRELDEIRCELIHTSAAAGPFYNALSYTWGDPLDLHPKPVLINRGFIEVTKNLFAALRSLRHVDAPHTLWIDALCINQRDDDERNAQVLLMGQIYSSASNVIIWLGEPRDDSAQAFSFFRHAVADGLTVCHPGQSLRYGIASGTEDSKFEKEIGQTTIRAVEILLSRAWFTRIWIVQEFLLGPRSTRILVCGGQSIPWSTLEDVFQSTPLSTWRMGAAAHLLATAGYLAIKKFEDFSRKQNDLVAMLELFRSFNATNPRDKIYGLLGLLSEAECNGIKPDYRKSVEETYAAFARFCVERTRCLTILSSCNFNPSQWNRLSSWVPDWNLDDFRWVRMETYARIADIIRMPPVSALTRLAEAAFIEDGKKLTTPAVSLGKITKTWPVEPWWKLDDNKEGEGLKSPFWKSVFAHSISPMDNSNGSSSAIYTEPKEQDEYINLAMSLASTTPNPHSSSLLNTRSYLLSRALRGEEGPQSKMLVYAALTEGRHFFETTIGEIGVADRIVGPDTTIFYIPGARLPVALNGPRSAGWYSLMGDCYVHVPVPQITESVKSEHKVELYTEILDAKFGAGLANQTQNRIVIG